MTDILLVPGAGQGIGVWGQVWGYLTAPVTHPPQLRVATAVGKVHPMGFPSNGVSVSGRRRSIGLHEAVSAVAEEVASQGLRDLVVVGHSAGAAILLAAVPKMPVTPKRIVMFSGIVPWEGESILSTLPLDMRLFFRLVSLAHRLIGRELRPPRRLIYKALCNGMDPMEVVKYEGSFNPLPLRVLQGKLSFQEGSIPVTYVVLERDRVLSPKLQRQMAERISNAEVLSLDSCHQAMLQCPREVAEIILRYA